MRVGFGYDAHRLVEGRDLILGGVTIPYEKGLLGHSDADVLLHAIIDWRFFSRHRSKVQRDCKHRTSKRNSENTL